MIGDSAVDGSASTVTDHGGQRILAPDSLLASRYRIVELVGVGGMGMVYRAHDERLGIDVAVKLLRPERAAEAQMLERFRQELILARQVSHPNVVRIHDIGQDGELHFITMDYVRGATLRRVLEERGRMEPAAAVRIAIDLAEALAAAHRQGVVHRDLKPGNVIVDETGRAHVTDFGVARSLTGAGLTRAGHVVGTPEYLAPEQATGAAVDGRADVFALGIILFEMLSGELPFGGQSFEELVAQRLTRAPRELDAGAAPASVRAVIRRCLARDPVERYADAAEIAADLRAERVPMVWRIGQRRAAVALATIAALGLAAASSVLIEWPGVGWEGSGVPATPARAIAVLPFVDDTARTELGWMSKGLAEMLAAALTENTALQVTDSLRVFETVEALHLAPGELGTAQLRQLADLLSVDYVLIARLRPADGRVRIDARLVATMPSEGSAREFHTAAREPGAALELVNELEIGIRGVLEMPVDDATVRAAGMQPADGLAAYARGLQHVQRGDSIAALPELQRAVALAPEFPAAWVRLSTAYEQLGRTDDALDAARRAAALTAGSDSRVAMEARARKAALEGDVVRARELLAELVAAYPLDAEARLALAEAYGEEGRYHEADTELRRVVADDAQHPRGWYLLGKYSILAGDLRSAVDDHLVRALVIHKRLDSAQGQADVLNAFGIAHHELGELDRAADYYAQAGNLRRGIGDQRGYAASLANLARLHAQRGAHEEAGRRLREALVIREALGEKAGVAELHNEFGVLEEERGRYREALDHYRQALELRRDLGDRRALAESHNNVGFSFYVLGEYDNAGVYWQRALALYEETRNREGLMLARQNLGLLEVARGQWSRALKTFLETLETARELDNAFAQAVSHANLGRVAHFQGRLAAAHTSFARAIALMQENGDLRGEVEFALLDAAALLDGGRRREARDALGRLRAALGTGGNREQRAELRRLEAEMALAAGDRDTARTAFRDALAEAKASGSVTIEISCRLGLVEAGLAAGERTLEEPARELVVSAARIGHAPLRLRAAVAAARAALAAGRPAAARELAVDALAPGRVPEAWIGSYRLRAALAEAEAALGERAAAARSWHEAAGELTRLRAEMDEGARTAFAQIAEVGVIDTEALGARPDRTR